jgi:hypothetical protein
MKDRCYNSNNVRYYAYGGRGIYICDEWLGSEGYINFRNWALSNGYRDDLTIDRKDVNGPYCPDNCRWATIQEQNWNKTTTVRTEYCGKLVTAFDLCKNFNLTVDLKTLSRRLANEGGNYTDWSMNDKMFIPAGIRRDTYRAEHGIVNPIIFNENQNK